MAATQLLSTVGLIRPSKGGGFCPACRALQSGDTPRELAPPALIALAFVIVAVLAWGVTLARSSSMDAMEMGLGSIGPFVASWTVMMTAMMLPSATPLMFAFARNAEGRRGWQAATALVGVSYLGVWLAFGVVCYLLYNAIGMPWADQGVIGGAALVIAGLYAFTPVKRACEAWCRELRVLHGPLPFDVMRGALVAGVRYGLSCLGCSAAVMLAMVLIGLSNVVWMIALSAVMLISRLAPASMHRWGQVVLSAGLVALGLLFALGT